MNLVGGDEEVMPPADETSGVAAAPSSAIYFPNLDGLRFLAFLTVFLAHVSGNLQPFVPPASFAASLFEVVFRSAWAGVSFFFVLSGFLITYLILLEVHATGRVDVRAFYIRRILRIWPLYYATLAFAMVIYPLIKRVIGVSEYVQYGRAWRYLVFLGNFDVIELGPGRGAASTNITWSVAIEEQFYLVWPLLFFLVPPRFYKLIFPVIILLSVAFRSLNVNDGMVLYFHSAAVISDMAVGGLAAYAAMYSHRFRSLFERLSKPAMVITYLTGVSMFVFAGPVTAALGAPAVVLQRIAFALFFAFIVVEQSYSRNSLLKMQSLKTVSKLGVYTYGLYLLHPVVITLLRGVLRFLRWETPSFLGELIFALAAFVGSVALALFSYTYYEKPFLRLKRRFQLIETRSNAATT
jgi:peptidoglycan/LPS O-acetylase OafA/YrhL